MNSDDLERSVLMRVANLTVCQYVLFVFGAVFFTLVVHELGHTLVGVVLGNEMTMDLNGSRPIAGRYTAMWHFPVVAASGPIVTMGQSLGGAVLLRRTGDVRVYPVVLFPFLYRIVPYVISLREPARLTLQDEAIVAATLGLDPWIGAGAVILPLGALAWYGTRVVGVTRRRAVGTAALAIAFAALLIG